MMPRETAKRLLARMIDQFTLWHGLEIRSPASTIFRRQDIDRGSVADESYNVQTAALIRRKENIDLSIDPPPDIVIEIETSRSALDKLAIFGSIGIS